MRLLLFIVVLVTACIDGGRSCNVCTLCAGATERHYFPELHAVICLCTLPAKTTFMGYDVPKTTTNVLDVNLNEKDCSAVEATWQRAVTATGGSCQSADETTAELYGTAICD